MEGVGVTTQRIRSRGRWLPAWRIGRASPRGASVILTLALCLLSLPFFLSNVGPPPKVAHGIAEFHGVALDRPVELSGDWRFTWRSAPSRAAFSLGVPGPWAGHRTANGGPLPHSGQATYSLTLRDLSPGLYRIYVPAIDGASRLSVNGETLAENGMLGPRPRYLIRPLEGDFRVIRGAGDVTVAVDVATRALRASGIQSSPVVGRLEAMKVWGARRWMQEFIVLVALFLLGIMGAVVFLFRRTDQASLYLAAMCFAFIPASLYAGYDNILALLVPQLGGVGGLAFSWVTGTLGVAALLANVNSLFPAESPRRIYRTLLSATLGFAAAMLATFALFGSYAGSRLAELLPLLFVVILGYVVVVVARAAWRRRDGAAPLLVGVAIASLGIIAVAAVAAGEVAADDVARGANYAAFGASCLLFANLVVLAERWSHAITATEQSNEDLRGLLEVNTAITSDLELGSLLERIVGATSKIVRADRSTLFLKDPQSPQLAALVAEGVDTDKLRFDVGRGLAGYVYATGETINIQDAYADDRFNRSVDEATGYRTRSVLTIPISTRDGRRLGVMQALNRTEESAFTAEDAARMNAFGAQAAVAIDNARLFGDALAAKNFDDSILLSMSGGVIALDNDWRITKVNAAAAEILGASPTLLGGLEVRTLLHGQNPWLIDELKTVADSGEAKLLLDIELHTARARPSSVNLSIAPLLGERGPVGLLLVIEDISEGKRLQGAMRRFMTQEVVDQVLARDDEPLFGTACRASVLFADIRNFTSMSEKLTPRETVDMLNEVLGELFEAVSDTDGILDKYIGDAVMAVYGVPFAGKRDAANAVTAALRMQELIGAINRRRTEQGRPPLALGVGIATGEVIAGTIGSPRRMDYTVIGDSVNLAARLEELTKTYPAWVIISETTAAEVDGHFVLRELDTIRVRGREAEERIFAVDGRR